MKKILIFLIILHLAFPTFVYAMHNQPYAEIKDIYFSATYGNVVMSTVGGKISGYVNIKANTDCKVSVPVIVYRNGNIASCKIFSVNTKKGDAWYELAYIEAIPDDEIKVFSWSDKGIKLHKNYNLENRKQKPAILLLGDSLFCDYENNSPRQGIGKFFSSHLDMNSVNFLNISQPGSVTSDYVKDNGIFYHKWINALKSVKQGDIVIVGVGYNEKDFLLYEKNLELISQSVKEKGGKVVFVTTNVQLDYNRRIVVNNKLAGCVNSMKKVCEKTGDLCLDLNYELWRAFSEMGYGNANSFYEYSDIFGNWLHFNEKGASYCANILAELAKNSNSELGQYIK